MEKKMLIEGMMCNHCKMTVEKALAAVDGVAAATVDLESKTATITLSSDVADDVLFSAVRAKKFEPIRMI